jgi:hypothetical protein
MFMDEPATCQLLPRQGKPRAEAHAPMFRAAAIVVAAISLATMGFILVRRANTPSPDPAPAPQALPPLFQGWPKPDVAIVLSGQQHGYLQPCGCTRPQYGGLARRFNFSQTLRDRGWPVVAVDLGDVAQKSAPQTMLKYVTSMKALQLMHYTGVGIGHNELALDLSDVLAEFALNNDTPRVLAANLTNRDQVDPADRVKAWTLADAKAGPRVGVAGVVAPSMAKGLPGPTPIRLDPVDKVLPQAIAQLSAQKAELLVLLFQGPLDEAKACAAKFPQFQLILCHCREDEPPGDPDRVKDTLIIRIGHKGRYVGVVGASRPRAAGQPFELRYQMVRLGEEFETPQGQDAKNPVHALLESYTREVRDRKFLAAYSRMPHPVQVEKEYADAKYVGSERCQKCHDSEYKVWAASAHSHAYDTLVKATRPALRQYDGECVKCHVVGFEYQTGYTDEKATAPLLHVGCESCHGPGSRHIANNFDEKLNALMNPWKPKPDEDDGARKRRLNQIDQFCQKCHDLDNDAHWDFKKKWPPIAHPMPR